MKNGQICKESQSNSLRQIWKLMRKSILPWWHLHVFWSVHILMASHFSMCECFTRVTVVAVWWRLTPIYECFTAVTVVTVWWPHTLMYEYFTAVVTIWWPLTLIIECLDSVFKFMYECYTGVVTSWWLLILMHGNSLMVPHTHVWMFHCLVLSLMAYWTTATICFLDYSGGLQCWYV